MRISLPIQSGKCLTVLDSTICSRLEVDGQSLKGEKMISLEDGALQNVRITQNISVRNADLRVNNLDTLF